MELQTRKWYANKTNGVFAMPTGVRVSSESRYVGWGIHPTGEWTEIDFSQADEWKPAKQEDVDKVLIWYANKRYLDGMIVEDCVVMDIDHMSPEQVKGNNTAHADHGGVYVKCHKTRYNPRAIIVVLDYSDIESGWAVILKDQK